MRSIPSIGGTFVVEPTAITMFAAGQLVDGVLVADLDPARTDDPGGSPDRRRAGRLEARSRGSNRPARGSLARLTM